MTKRKRLFAALSYGCILGCFYIFRNLSEADNYTTSEILESVGGGLLEGAFAGLLFWWILGIFFTRFMGWFVKKFTQSDLLREQMKIMTNPGESIQFEKFATHFKGIERVGGKMYLTQNRLIFKSHHFNIQNHQLSMDLEEITEASDCEIDSYKALAITRTNNRNERFEVEQLDEWLSRLNKVITGRLQ
jgi:hypothetical protein